MLTLVVARQAMGLGRIMRSTDSPQDIKNAYMLCPADINFMPWRHQVWNMFDPLLTILAHFGRTTTTALALSISYSWIAKIYQRYWNPRRAAGWGTSPCPSTALSRGRRTEQQQMSMSKQRKGVGCHKLPGKAAKSCQEANRVGAETGSPSHVPNNDTAPQTEPHEGGGSALTSEASRPLPKLNSTSTTLGTSSVLQRDKKAKEQTTQNR